MFTILCVFNVTATNDIYAVMTHAFPTRRSSDLPGRRAIGEPHDLAPSPQRLGNAAKAGAGRIGAGLAIARHPDDDQARIVALQVFGCKIPSFERARPEIFDQDGGTGDQLARPTLHLFGSQVGARKRLV